MYGLICDDNKISRRWEKRRGRRVYKVDNMYCLGILASSYFCYESSRSCEFWSCCGTG